jgi:hypothetical protein
MYILFCIYIHTYMYTCGAREVPITFSQTRSEMSLPGGVPDPLTQCVGALVIAAGEFRDGSLHAWFLVSQPSSRHISLNT